MLRRTIGISAAAAAVTIAAILPAAAQTSPGGLASYAAGSKATALDLSVFGQPVTVASTTAGIDSTAKAVANGNALLTPAFNSAGALAESGTPHETASDCQQVDLPEPIDLAALDIVCVNTSAVLQSGNPVSSAASNEIVIEITAPALVSGTPLADVVGGVQDGLGQLFDALVPVTEQLPQGTVDQLQGILDGLLAEVQQGDVLARITVAPTSSTGAFGAGVAANAVSNGAIVELLPNLPGGALAVATVGSSTAGVVRDINTGEATPSGQAAVINVTFPNGLLGGLQVLTDALGNAVNVTSEQLACTPDNPLRDVICFTLGSSHQLNAEQAKALDPDLDFGPNTVGQESSVLGLTLLAAAPGGGVGLDIGHTVAASGSTLPAPAATTTTLPPLPGGPTPRALTGSESSVALALTFALLALGTAGAVLLRRSRTSAV